MLLSSHLLTFFLKLSFEILKCESVDQEQQLPHPSSSSSSSSSSGGLKTERDKSCCQGHSSAFARPWLSKGWKGSSPWNTFWLAPAFCMWWNRWRRKWDGEREKERERERESSWEDVRGTRAKREGSLHFADTEPYHTVTLWIIARDRLWAPLSQNAGQNNTPPRGFLWHRRAEALTAAPCKAS